MGVSYNYLSQVSSGRRFWTPMLRERAQAVLGEVPGQGVVYRQGGVIASESNYIRERAREVGLRLGELADRVGVSLSYLSQASRGKRNLGPKVQARVEAELQAPARVEPAQRPTVEPSVLWQRMDAHGWSQNETARLAGISPALLSQIMNGKRTPSGRVLGKLHGVLFRPSAAELVMSAEVKVLGWKKDERQGVWCAAPADRAAAATITAAGLCVSAAGCPRARRSSTPTARATTAGDGCSWTTWSTSRATR